MMDDAWAKGDYPYLQKLKVFKRLLVECTKDFLLQM